jgi:hypothetical protein
MCEISNTYRMMTFVTNLQYFELSIMCIVMSNITKHFKITFHYFRALQYWQKLIFTGFANDCRKFFKEQKISCKISLINNKLLKR